MRLVSLISGLILNLPAWADPELDANTLLLKQKIDELVTLRALARDEAQTWDEKSKNIDQLLALHQAELALLDEELAQAGQSAAGFDEKQLAAQDQIARLKKTRTLVSSQLTALSPRIQKLATLFPAPLQSEITTDLETLKNWAPPAEPRDALRATLSLLAAAETFNRGIRRASEVRNDREVQVIYLGLARAFYYAPNGTAGIGEPSREGWTWQDRPELSSTLANLIDQLDKKHPPTLRDLPIRVVEKEDQP